MGEGKKKELIQFLITIMNGILVTIPNSKGGYKYKRVIERHPKWVEVSQTNIRNQQEAIDYPRTL